MEGSTSRRDSTEACPLALPSPCHPSPRKPPLPADIDVFGTKKPNVATIRLTVAKSSTAGLRTTISSVSLAMRFEDSPDGGPRWWQETQSRTAMGGSTKSFAAFERARTRRPKECKMWLYKLPPMVSGDRGCSN